MDAAGLRQDFGDEAWHHFTNEARPHIAARHLRVTDDNYYILTRDGIMLSDAIIRDLLSDQ